MRTFETFLSILSCQRAKGSKDINALNAPKSFESVTEMVTNGSL